MKFHMKETYSLSPSAFPPYISGFWAQWHLPRALRPVPVGSASCAVGDIAIEESPIGQEPFFSQTVVTDLSGVDPFFCLKDLDAPAELLFSKLALGGQVQKAASASCL